MAEKKGIILGIDPGSRITGFGLIQFEGNHYHYLDSGQIQCNQKSMPQRLLNISEQLCQVIERHRPDEVAVEQVFTHINHQAALKLGQARGIALLAAAKYCLEVFEYSPRSVKQAVAGYGAANKLQMQQMVRSILKLTHTPKADAADALAIAITHAHTQPLRQKIASATEGIASTT